MMCAELDFEILRRPPDEKQFDVEQQTIGKFYSLNKKTLKSENLGYYLVRLYLKADSSELKKIDNVVFRLLSPSKPDVMVSDSKNEFQYLVTLFDEILKVEYTIHWVNGAPKKGEKTFVLKPEVVSKSRQLESGT